MIREKSSQNEVQVLNMEPLAPIKMKRVCDPLSPMEGQRGAGGGDVSSQIGDLEVPLGRRVLLISVSLSLCDEVIAIGLGKATGPSGHPSIG